MPHSGKSSGKLLKSVKLTIFQFLIKVIRIKQKERKPQCFHSLKLELIARFELATSSLPKMEEVKIACYSLILIYAEKPCIS